MIVIPMTQYNRYSYHSGDTTQGRRGGFRCRVRGWDDGMELDVETDYWNHGTRNFAGELRENTRYNFNRSLEKKEEGKGRRLNFTKIKVNYGRLISRVHGKGV